MSQRESTVAPPAGVSSTTAVRLAGLERSLASALNGKPEVIRLSLVCLLARGHLLIEDVPGVG
ncbi:MAG TPA: ATPase, partial [Verrucomicrobiae bacterium]|nr:ATPase [Verrucomicrobiae bacterium]